MRYLLAALALAGALFAVPAAAQPVCLVAGDSIALDVGHAARQCVTDAKIGIGSAAIIQRVRPAGMVVISAGSNDPDNRRLAVNLEVMRARAGAARVVWIVPVHRRAAGVVRGMAARHRDRAVAFAPAGDHVHPRCPRCLAREIFRIEGHTK